VASTNRRKEASLQAAYVPVAYTPRAELIVAGTSEVFFYGSAAMALA
jgi:hypothetical protein